MTFKSAFICIVLFIDVSCRWGSIFLMKHDVLNKYYYARNPCPTTCKQPCYLKPFSMVKEEEKGSPHDRQEVTSSNSKGMSSLTFFIFYVSLHLTQPCYAHFQNNINTFEKNLFTYVSLSSW